MKIEKPEIHFLSDVPCRRRPRLRALKCRFLIGDNTTTPRIPRQPQNQWVKKGPLKSLLQGA